MYRHGLATQLTLDAELEACSSERTMMCLRLIAAGTSEIEFSVIAQQVRGLPRG
ncbi:MAG: hypothetical protein ACM4D3_24850 [Candidatus Sericytochromatia bacterium]